MLINDDINNQHLISHKFLYAYKIKMKNTLCNENKRNESKYTY